MTDHAATIREMAEQGHGDAAIAARLGLSKMAVYRRRTKLGIGANLTRFVPTAEQLEELRTSSNRAMERKYGVHKETWRKARANHGIPAFRPPTVINGEPNRFAPPRPAPRPRNDYGHANATVTAPMRDHSLAGEAAAFLRRDRFSNVYDRAKVLGKPGWQVGRMVLSAAEMVAMASRRGFRDEAWMGGL